MWIRNQDKSILVDVKAVQMIVSQEGIKIVDGHDHFFTLGVYLTYEKAIEVLDMIQEHIEKQIRYEFVLENDVTKFLPIIENRVFQMPKDKEL